MSSNRLLYDDCAKTNQNKIDTNQLKWVLDKHRFINENNCRIDEGIMSGNTQGNNKFSNRVDLETKLFGIGNIDSKCKGSMDIEYKPQNMKSCQFFNIENQENQETSEFFNIENQENNDSNQLINNTCK